MMESCSALEGIEQEAHSVEENEEVEKMRETLNLRMEQVGNLEQSMQTLEAEVKRLNTSLKEAKKTNMDLERKLTDTSTENRRNISKVADLEQQNRMLKAENEAL